MTSYDYLYKIILLGDTCTGKSSYLHRLMTGNPIDVDVRSTVGVDFRSKVYNINNTRIKLHIWDTAGQEIYRSIVSSYYREAIGILLFVDMSQPQTYNKAEQWLKDIKRYFEGQNLEDSVKIMVVANKFDLATETSAFIQWIEKVKLDYRMVSTKDYDVQKLEDVIIALAKKIDRAWPQGSHKNIRKCTHEIKLNQRRRRSFCDIL